MTAVLEKPLVIPAAWTQCGHKWGGSNANPTQHPGLQHECGKPVHTSGSHMCGGPRGLQPTGVR